MWMSSIEGDLLKGWGDSTHTSLLYYFARLWISLLRPCTLYFTLSLAYTSKLWEGPLDDMYCYRSKIWGSQNAKYGPFRLLVGIGLSQPKGGAPFELGTGSLLGFLLRLSQLTLGPPLSCDCLSSPHIYFILYCSLSLWCSLLFPRGLDFTLSWAFT